MSPDAATHETSVTFSLQELMKLEQERIAEQEQRRKREAEQREQAAQEAQRRSEREEQQRLAAEQQARRLQEQREREEQAKLEAMRHAMIESERQKALQQARLAQAEHERQHQLQLEALRQSGLVRRLRAALLAVSIGSIVLLGGMLTGWLGVVQPQADRKLEALTQSSAMREQENAMLKRKLDAQTSQLDKLLDQVRAGHLERSVLAARLEEATRELEGRGARPGQGSSAAVRPPVVVAPECPPGSMDPLCGLGAHR